MSDLRQCEQAVLAAAREERAAHAALINGISPQHPDWSDDEEAAYRARLRRWQAASRAVVEALHGFQRARGEGRAQSPSHLA
jgi:hypothetical protein